MKVRNQLVALLVVPALVLIQAPTAFSSTESYKAIGQYTVASNHHNKHPKQKREIASAKKAKKKKTQKRKVASAKKSKKKSKSKKKKHKSLI